MSIVSLTTDFGLKDYYVAALKGSLLSTIPDIRIVDVSHQINSFDIVEAAFVIKNAYPSFPKETIHIICVNNFHEHLCPYLLFKKEDQYFIGPDNGIFSLVFESFEEEIYKIHPEKISPAMFSETISNLVNEISHGTALDQLGPKVNGIVQRIHMRPVISANSIRGVVIHVDSYENAIINIQKDLFLENQRGRSFSIYFNRFDPIKKISEHYHNVPVGETLCTFNSSGYLEIAINMGKASSLLGLKENETIQIDFE